MRKGKEQTGPKISRCVFYYYRFCRRSRPAGSAVVIAIYTYTRTTEILWRKRDGAATLSRGERP